MITGTHHTEETKIKMSVAHKGWRHSEESKRLISQSKKGIRTSPKSEFKKGHKIWLGRRHTEEMKKEMSDARKGINNPMWKGGVTPLYKLIHSKITKMKLPYKVFERDGFTCQKCSKRGGILNAHHIKPIHSYPKLALNLDNMITLCESCHNKVHVLGKSSLEVVLWD